MLIKKLIPVPVLKNNEFFPVRKMGCCKKNFLWMKGYFLLELEPEPKLANKIPGAGQKRTGSAPLGVTELK